MQTDKELSLAETVFQALALITNDGLILIIVAVIAALFLYIGLPGGAAVKGEPEDSNRSTNEKEIATDKEKHGDK